MRLSVPRGRGKNTTVLSSMTLSGMGPSLAVEGATTAVVFEAYVERVLVPALRPGQVVVMDKLGAHRPKRIRELIEARGCELLYLPSYSPDYNPIEEAFAKLKRLLRQAAARSKEALVGAIGVALWAVTEADGYCARARPTAGPATARSAAAMDTAARARRHADMRGRRTSPWKSLPARRRGCVGCKGSDG